MSAGLKITLLFIAALVAQQSPTTPPRGDGTIAGQVVDASTGKPVGAVFVTLVGPVSVPQPSTFAVLTTSDSRFVFRALAAGEYGIAAMKQGYSQGLFNQVRPEGTGQPIRVESDRSLTDVTLRVWKQAAITGTVVDEAGEPVVGVHVRAFRRRSIAGRFEIAGAALAETDDGEPTDSAACGPASIW